MTVETKCCTKCGEEKPVGPGGEFGRSRTSRGKQEYHAKCKACVATQAREIRERNPEKARKQQRSSYAKHREKRRAEMRGRYAENREQYLANNAEYKRRRAKENPALVRAERAYYAAAKRSPLETHEAFRNGLTWAEAVALHLHAAAECLRLEAETGEAHHVDHQPHVQTGVPLTEMVITARAASENMSDTHLDRQFAFEWYTHTDEEEARMEADPFNYVPRKAPRAWTVT